MQNSQAECTQLPTMVRKNIDEFYWRGLFDSLSKISIRCHAALTAKLMPRGIVAKPKLNTERKFTES